MIAGREPVSHSEADGTSVPCHKVQCPSLRQQQQSKLCNTSIAALAEVTQALQTCLTGLGWLA